jgi:hypothetical protein
MVREWIPFKAVAG